MISRWNFREHLKWLLHGFKKLPPNYVQVSLLLMLYFNHNDGGGIHRFQTFKSTKRDGVNATNEKNTT